MIKKLLLLFTVLAFTQFCFGQIPSLSAAYDFLGAQASHTLYRCPNGTVKSCGYNSSGQLGLNDNFNRKLTEIIPNLTDVTIASAGGDHSLFLKNDGTVLGCGGNDKGQLGDGTTINKQVPIQLSALSGVQNISAGKSHSLFLKTDSSVWACGSNDVGQLGDGTTVNKNSPVQVLGLTQIVAISAGLNFSLFLKVDGTVWACGKNDVGQLGDGSGSDNNTPVQVTSLSNIKAISAGGYHSLFLKNDNTVLGCGFNFFQQITDYSDVETYMIPLQIPNLNNITSISAGRNYSLFLKTDSSVWSCGHDAFGQSGKLGALGSSGLLSWSSLHQIIGLNSIIEISAGPDHSAFRKNDGTVWVCGNNSYSQLGDGGERSFRDSPFNLGGICATTPTPPTVNFTDFPTSVCLGSTINVNPSITGSNPKLVVNTDYSIVVTAPKAIDKNHHAVFVLNDNDNIVSYNLDGTLRSNYPNLNITGIKAFTVDSSDNVYVNKTDGNIYKCNNTGTLLSTIPSDLLGPNPTDMVLTHHNSMFAENFFVLDTNYFNWGDLMTGINIDDLNNNTNSQSYSMGYTINLPNVSATSIAIDNYYPEQRMLLTDPVNSKIWSRKVYDASANLDEKLLIDSAITAGLKLDFIDADSTQNVISVSSSTTNKLGLIYTDEHQSQYYYFAFDGVLASYATASIQPVGMVATKFDGNQMQLWIADRGLNKLIRASMFFYQVFPELPEGLTFNSLTGKIEGAPKNLSAPQTYYVVLSNQYGADTTAFTFAVTPSNSISNAAGISTTSGQQKEGETIKYYNANNCEKLIEIADSIGGTSPGQTQISQNVLPIVSVIASDTLIRRVVSINAERSDPAKANVKIFYSYQDIQLFNQSRGSNLLSNDTINGTMQMAILQMHDKPDGSKEPIIHSPVAAKWSTTEHHWEASFWVSKFSQFYGSDIATLASFDCSTTRTDSVVTNNNYYVWNNDSIFTSGTYLDTLINQTGCDSVITLKLTLNTVGILTPILEKGISLYPNPTNGLINLKINNPNITLHSIKIYNILGAVVHSTAQVNPKQSIDLSNMQKGVYFIQITTGQETITKKIMLE